MFEQRVSRQLLIQVLRFRTPNKIIPTRSPKLWLWKPWNNPNWAESRNFNPFLGVKISIDRLKWLIKKKFILQKLKSVRTLCFEEQKIGNSHIKKKLILVYIFFNRTLARANAARLRNTSEIHLYHSYSLTSINTWIGNILSFFSVCNGLRGTWQVPLQFYYTFRSVCSISGS